MYPSLSQFELASEKKKDSFSTQPVLDSKLTRCQFKSTATCLLITSRALSLFLSQNLQFYITFVFMKRTIQNFEIQWANRWSYWHVCWKVTHVHEMCILNNYPQFLKKVIRDCLATCARYVEQVKSYCEDKSDDDELLLKENMRMNFLSCGERQILRSKRFLQIILRKWSTIVRMLVSWWIV